MKTVTRVVVLAAVALATGPVHAAPVNGDFSAGLTGWDTAGDVSNGGGRAVLAENPTAIMTTLSQEFSIEAAATTLSFDYLLGAEPGGPTGSPFGDALQVSLLDPGTLAPLLHSPGVSDYFYTSNLGTEQYDPALVTVTGDTVTLGLTPLGDVDALLAFDLLGGDDGMATIVQVDNVRLTVIPEPATFATLALTTGALAGYLRRRRRRKPSPHHRPG